MDSRLALHGACSRARSCRWRCPTCSLAKTLPSTLRTTLGSDTNWATPLASTAVAPASSVGSSGASTAGASGRPRRTSAALLAEALGPRQPVGVPLSNLKSACPHARRLPPPGDHHPILPIALVGVVGLATLTPTASDGSHLAVFQKCHVPVRARSFRHRPIYRSTEGFPGAAFCERQTKL